MERIKRTVTRRWTPTEVCGGQMRAIVRQRLDESALPETGSSDLTTAP